MIATVIAMGLFSLPVSAHVTVKPATSGVSSWETYTIKVPVEKDMATTKITLKIPEGVEFQQYEPVPGWKVSEQKDTSGKIKSVTWEATGEGILPGQFQQFTFIAKNPDKEQKVPWDAYQQYKDGDIVEWTGDEKTDKPHSFTTITKGTVLTGEHGELKASDSKEKESTSLQITAILLSILSIIVSLGTCIFVFRRKKQ
ncbi:YcnI family protein [Bacillus sp. CGMCC 1.60114]|uniref:YcnI family copper-binding membrane protein n=1 Tax=unclassified Bacillus (in: firmicutes) TaxID=185979 RepID=UPI00363DE2C7